MHHWTLQETTMPDSNTRINTRRQGVLCNPKKRRPKGRPLLIFTPSPPRGGEGWGEVVVTSLRLRGSRPCTGGSRVSIPRRHGRGGCPSAPTFPTTDSFPQNPSLPPPRWLR